MIHHEMLPLLRSTTPARSPSALLGSACGWGAERSASFLSGMPMHAFNRFTAHSVYGLRAARDTVVAELREHYGWAPGPAFTLAELGGLPQPTVSANEMAACLGVRTLHYRAIASGQPAAIVAIFRAGAVSPGGTINGAPQGALSAPS
jgi:hypothetical protein